MSEPITTVSTSRRHVLQAAGIVAAAFVLSRLMGWVRDAVFGYYFGVDTSEAIAFVVANRFPELIFNVVVGGALGSAFIPTFAAYFERNDEAGAWRLFAAVINLVIIVTTLLAAVAFLLAAPISQFFLPPAAISADPTLLPLTVSLMRLMLLSPIIFGVSGVVMGALNARQHFLTPALAASMYNVGIIVGLILFAPNVMGAAVGTVLGALGHLVIQLPSLRQKRGRYTPILTLRDEGVQQVLRLMAPRILGLSFSYINPVVILYLTRSLTIGSQVALERAFRVMLMPYSILGQAMGVAAFPTLSTLAARRAWGDMQQILSDSLRSILFLGLPISIGLMVLRLPLITLLYQYGRFDQRDTELVAWGLLFYTIGMIALATLEIVSRAFYALGDTTTPVIAGMIQLPVMAVLGIWLSQRLFPALGLLDFGGLALAHSLSNYLEIGVLLLLLRGRIGGIGGRRLLDGSWRILAASLLMGAAIWLLLQNLPDFAPLIQLAAGSLVGIALYAVGCLLFQIGEFQQLLAYGRKMISR